MFYLFSVVILLGLCLLGCIMCFIWSLWWYCLVCVCLGVFIRACYVFLKLVRRFVFAAVCEFEKYDKDLFCQLLKLYSWYLILDRRFVYSHFKNLQTLIFSLTLTNRLTSLFYCNSRSFVLRLEFVFTIALSVSLLHPLSHFLIHVFVRFLGRDHLPVFLN